MPADQQKNSSQFNVTNIMRHAKGILKDLGKYDRPEDYLNQNYSQLKRECQSSGQLFEDPEFPCNMHSLFYSNRSIPASAIEWRRPHEITDSPALIKGGFGRHDVNQGKLGNCWFVAAASVLAEFPAIRKKVIPDQKEQEFGSGYAGIFHFVFYRFGRWVDVVIDDRLPCRNGQLLFIKSTDQTEYWGALIEKAYAKLAGSYEGLDGGNLTDALVDFTGGIAETVDLEGSKYVSDSTARERLFQQLRKQITWDTLMCAAITVKHRDEMEKQLSSGLVKGHAYGITGVTEVSRNEHPGLFGSFLGNFNKFQLIRLRNPWGKKEWNGLFSDRSEVWDQISSEERKRLGLVLAEDGEFWMPFEDFLKGFSMLSVCHIMYASMIGTIISGGAPYWNEALFEGEWRRPELAGGCINNRSTFLNNPQYRFDITNSEEEIMISLEQKDMRRERHAGKNEYLAIGFQVLRVEDNRDTRLHSVREVIGASIYINSRMVIMSKMLPKGRYVVIPSTFQPNQEGDFLIRIYTGGANNAKEMTDGLSYSGGHSGGGLPVAGLLKGLKSLF